MATRSYTTNEVLEKFTSPIVDGIFTDGGAQPNPGPGGWGFVWVENGEVSMEKHGHSEATTNNIMELTALIEAYKVIPDGKEIILYSDSDLCVKTINEWAAGWEKRGWKRKTGPIKNLELVQELYALSNEKPFVGLKWIKAHNGDKWNEYADSLATAWTRNET